MSPSSPPPSLTGPLPAGARQPEPSTFTASVEPTTRTHQSTTDPDARLYKKARGREVRLRYLGHVLMEHRSGLIVKATVTPADGYGERDAALVMMAGLRGRHRIRVAAYKGYDVRDFVAELRYTTVTPHTAQHATRRRSTVDGRTTRHPGYAISQRKRKLVEQGFGWMKTIAGLRNRHAATRVSAPCSGTGKAGAESKRGTSGAAPYSVPQGRSVSTRRRPIRTEP
jgi:hypothetical protein